MEKGNKFKLFILFGLVFGILGTLIVLAIVKENFSHWWYISYSFVLLLLTIIWLVYWLYKKGKKEEKPKEKKAEPIKKSVIDYQEIVNKYWKHPMHTDPDMLEVGDRCIPFPNKESETGKIIDAVKYNERTKVLLYVGTKSRKVEDVILGTDIEKFRLILKPKLESVTEKTEEDPFGRKSTVKFTKPIIDKEVKKMFEAEKKAEAEKEKIDTMQSTKKEEEKK